MPSTDITATNFADGEIGVLDLLVLTKLAPSKGEGRRLIDQGGISVDNEKILSSAEKLSLNHFEKKYVVIKKGKKVFHKVNLVD